MLMETNATGTFDEVLDRMSSAVEGSGFGILAIHDFKKTMESKGIPFPARCTVFEVCNPPFAARILGRNIAFSTVLPCRISVYEQGEEVHIGLVSPSATIRQLTDDTELHGVAGEVENRLRQIVAAAV